MKRYLLLFAALYMVTAGHAQKKNFSYKFYGQVRGDLFYNSRANAEIVDGLFHLYPKDKNLDADGNDLNATANGSFYLLYSRLGVDVTGPNIGKAVTTAKLEADFRGSGSNWAVLRIRHAYVNLDWGKSAVLVGQTWHPLFGDVSPQMLNLSTGAPFQPFNRSPQIRYRYTSGKGLQLTGAVLWQLQYLSAGPNGKSEEYIKISCIPDAETRLSTLKSGEVMGLADNGAITMDAAKNLCDTDSSFEMDSTPSHMTEYIMFNDKNEYLADKRMREAFNLATARDSICSVIYGGLLQPAYSFLSTQSTFHLDIQGTYDMEQAKALAKEVLGDKTVDMTMIIRSSTASDYNCKAVAEYLKQVYAELGVNINIEIVDSSLYKERQQEGSYDMTLTVFGINNADPTSTFKQYFASEGNSNKTLNYNYYNEKIDELVAKAPTIADVEERSKIYDEIQQELFDDSACVPICYQINVNIHNKAITHYAGKTFGVGLPTISWVK